MCEVILGTLHCIILKLLYFFLVSLFSVALCRRSLRTHSQLYIETNATRPVLVDENEVVARCLPYCGGKRRRLCFNVSLMSY